MRLFVFDLSIKYIDLSQDSFYSFGSVTCCSISFQLLMEQYFLRLLRLLFLFGGSLHLRLPVLAHLFSPVLTCGSTEVLSRLSQDADDPGPNFT